MSNGIDPLTGTTEPAWIEQSHKNFEANPPEPDYLPAPETPSEHERKSEADKSRETEARKIEAVNRLRPLVDAVDLAEMRGDREAQDTALHKLSQELAQMRKRTLADTLEAAGKNPVDAVWQRVREWHHLPTEHTGQEAITEREWLIPGWLPVGRVTRLSSHGGSGKSYLALELAAAIVMGTDPDDDSQSSAIWRETNEVGAPVLARTPDASDYEVSDAALDTLPWGLSFRLAATQEAGKVLYLTWEDEPAELVRRIHRLPSGRVPDSVWKGLTALYMERSGPLWAALNHGHKDTVATLTDTGRYVEQQIRELRPALVVIDPVAAAYAGNENDRAAVRRWLSHLNGLALETGAAIVLISHPPKSTGAEYSGSTDWDNGVRCAWRLGPEVSKSWKASEKWKREGKDTTVAVGLSITRSKSNYSRTGVRVWLRWVPDTGKDVRRGLQECSEEESVRAWHESNGLPETKAKEEKEATKADATKTQPEGRAL